MDTAHQFHLDELTFYDRLVLLRN